MTAAQIETWLQVALLLIQAGAVGVAQIKAIFSAGGLTEEDQNVILDRLIQNAATRKRRSKTIANGPIS